MVSYSQFQKRGRKNAKQNSKFSFVLIGLLACSILCQNMIDGNNSISESKLMDIYPIASAGIAEPLEPLAVKEDLSNALGEIEIIDVNVLESLSHSNFVGHDNITYEVVENEAGDNDDQTTFIGTTQMASTANAIGSALDRHDNIIIQFLTEIIWTNNGSFAELDENVIGFTPIVQPATLSYLQVGGIKITNESRFYTDTNLGKNTFFYNFADEHLVNLTDTLGIRYYYTVNVPVSEWQVVTAWSETDTGEILSGGPQYLTDETGTFTQVFDYSVKIGGSADLPIRALTNIHLPNKNDIFDVSVDNFNGLNETDFSYDQSLLNEKIIEIDEYMNITSGASIGGQFFANFTVELLEIVDGYWCEDRLVSGTDHRERDYKLTITDGPDDLMLVYFGFNDTTIYRENLWGSELRSALGRDVSVVNMNITDPDADPSDYDDIIIIDGISLLAQSQLSPYLMFKGEVDIVTVQYIATNDLKFTVTDNIQTPLSDVQVNIYINNISYGTLMNQFENYPIPPKTSNSQGEVLIRNVPIANFTIEILDANGISKQNLTANSLNDYGNNLVITNKTHFPATILYFGGLSAVMIVVGILKFKKNQ